MKTYAINWSFGGYSYVEADSIEDAREKFIDDEEQHVRRASENGNVDIVEIKEEL